MPTPTVSGPASSSQSETPQTCRARVWRCRGCGDEMASGQTDYPRPPGRPLRNHIPNCAGLRSSFEKLALTHSLSKGRAPCASDLLKAFSAWPFDKCVSEDSHTLPLNYTVKPEGVYILDFLALEAMPIQETRLCRGCVPNKYRPMNRFKNGKSRCCYHNASRVNLLAQDMAIAGYGKKPPGSSAGPSTGHEPPWMGLIPECYRNTQVPGMSDSMPLSCPLPSHGTDGKRKSFGLVSSEVADSPGACRVSSLPAGITSVSDLGRVNSGQSGSWVSPTCNQPQSSVSTGLRILRLPSNGHDGPVSDSPAPVPEAALARLVPEPAPRRMLDLTEKVGHPADSDTADGGLRGLKLSPKPGALLPLLQHVLQARQLQQLRQLQQQGPHLAPQHPMCLQGRQPQIQMQVQQDEGSQPQQAVPQMQQHQVSPAQQQAMQQTPQEQHAMQQSIQQSIRQSMQQSMQQLSQDQELRLQDQTFELRTSQQQQEQERRVSTGALGGDSILERWNNLVKSRSHNGVAEEYGPTKCRQWYEPAQDHSQVEIIQQQQQQRSRLEPDLFQGGMRSLKDGRIDYQEKLQLLWGQELRQQQEQQQSMIQEQLQRRQMQQLQQQQQQHLQEQAHMQQQQQQQQQPHLLLATRQEAQEPQMQQHSLHALWQELREDKLLPDAANACSTLGGSFYEEGLPSARHVSEPGPGCGLFQEPAPPPPPPPPPPQPYHQQQQRGTAGAGQGSKKLQSPRGSAAPAGCCTTVEEEEVEGGIPVCNVPSVSMGSFNWNGEVRFDSYGAMSIDSEILLSLALDRAVSMSEASFKSTNSRPQSLIHSSSNSTNKSGGKSPMLSHPLVAACLAAEDAYAADDGPNASRSPRETLETLQERVETLRDWSR